MSPAALRRVYRVHLYETACCMIELKARCEADARRRAMAIWERDDGSRCFEHDYSSVDECNAYVQESRS